MTALTLGVTSFTAGATEPTVYQNGDRKVYIFYPKDRDNNQSSTRTRYDGPNVDYYRSPRGSVVIGSNRTYVKPSR